MLKLERGVRHCGTRPLDISVASLFVLVAVHYVIELAIQIVHIFHRRARRSIIIQETLILGLLISLKSVRGRKLIVDNRGLRRVGGEGIGLTHRICWRAIEAELIDAGALKPKLVIGAPVGFVNVEVSKEIIMERDVEYIVARGRKGGSNIAACICNALLYLATGRSL